MIKYLILFIVLVGCGLHWERKLSEMIPPIIVIGKDHKKAFNSNSELVVRDKNNNIMQLTGHQWTKNYNIGDTLK